MYSDPIVEQTRKLRNEYAAQFSYDLDAICKDLMERQRTSDRRLVRRLPKRLTHSAPTGNYATEQNDAREPSAQSVLNRKPTPPAP